MCDCGCIHLLGVRGASREDGQCQSKFDGLSVRQSLAWSFQQLTRLKRLYETEQSLNHRSRCCWYRIVNGESYYRPESPCPCLVCVAPVKDACFFSGQDNLSKIADLEGE